MPKHAIYALGAKYSAISKSSGPVSVRVRCLTAGPAVPISKVNIPSLSTQAGFIELELRSSSRYVKLSLLPDYCASML